MNVFKFSIPVPLLSYEVMSRELVLCGNEEMMLRRLLTALTIRADPLLQLPGEVF